MLFNNLLLTVDYSVVILPMLLFYEIFTIFSGNPVINIGDGYRDGLNVVNYMIRGNVCKTFCIPIGVTRSLTFVVSLMRCSILGSMWFIKDESSSQTKKNYVVPLSKYLCLGCFAKSSKLFRFVGLKKINITFRYFAFISWTKYCLVEWESSTMFCKKSYFSIFSFPNPKITFTFLLVYLIICYGLNSMLHIPVTYVYILPKEFILYHKFIAFVFMDFKPIHIVLGNAN